MLVLLLSLMAALLPFIVSYDDSRHQLLTLWVKVNGLTDQPKAPVFHEEEQHLIKLQYLFNPTSTSQPCGL